METEKTMPYIAGRPMRRQMGFAHGFGEFWLQKRNCDWLNIYPKYLPPVKFLSVPLRKACTWFKGARHII